MNSIKLRVRLKFGKKKLEDMKRSLKEHVVYLEVGDISRKSKEQSSDFKF